MSRSHSRSARIVANQPAYPHYATRGPTYRHWAAATILAGLNAARHPHDHALICNNDGIRRVPQGTVGEDNVAEAVRQADLLCAALASP